MQAHQYLIPEQQEGFQKNLIYSVSTDSVADAEDWFVEAKERLLDVNGWQLYSNATADFKLADNHGKTLKRHAHRGDHVRITLPTSDPSVNNDEWMKVEAIIYDDYPDDDREAIAIKLRPALNPFTNEDHEAHFMDSAVTCTIMVERRGAELISQYDRRIEAADTSNQTEETTGNITIALGVWLAVPDKQWAGIIKGVLDA